MAGARERGTRTVGSGIRCQRRPRSVPISPHVRFIHRWSEQHSSGFGGQDIHLCLPRLRYCAASRADRRGGVPGCCTVLATIAASPTSGCKVATASAGMPGGGHTHWSNGNSFYDGFTTALPPNTRSPAGPLGLDSDMTSEDEDDGGPTYAAVTSRSYHPGVVNTLFGDGSVRTIKSTIDYQTWRALGTVGGGEVISSDSY